MGRVYRRNGHWYLDYKDRNGRRVRRMVPDAEARTQRQAKELLAELEADELRVAREIRRGVHDARTNHVEIGLLLEAYLLHTAATKRYETARAWRSALAATVGGFVRDVAGRESKAWPPRREVPVDKLRGMPRRFVRGPLGVEFVDEVTPARVENWVSAGRSAYQGRTLVLRVKVLKALLTWAAKEGRIRSNPLDGFRAAARACEGRWRALSPEEAEALLRGSPEPYRTMWLAFLSTGMRNGELVKLTWPDVSFSTNSLRVRQETCKTHRQRDIPLTPALRERLLALWEKAEDPEGAVFPNRSGKPFTSNLDARFRACLRKAEISPRVVEEGGRWWLLDMDPTGRTVRQELADAKTREDAEAAMQERLWRKPRIVIHSLRHTFATELIRRGVNPKVVSELLGHTTVQMTLQKYAHVWPQDKVGAVAKLDFGRSFGTRESLGAEATPQRLNKTGT